MLEVKWKDRLHWGYNSDQIGFNPCYVGSKMESTHKVSRSWSNWGVSILVMLEVKWKVILEETLTDLRSLFQSLLCWK